jgi:hypothetical protein
MIDEGYHLGKDIALMQESLCRIEARLDSCSRVKTSSCGETRTEAQQTISHSTLVSPPAVPIPKEHRRDDRLLSTIRWRATDVSQSKRALAPTGDVEFSFFGFMLDGASGSNSTLISQTVWSEVADLYAQDRSATPYYYYRPTGFKGDVCVLGGYSQQLNLWNWVAIEFWHTYSSGPGSGNQNLCCMVFTYGNDGTMFQSKYGWDPDVLILFGQYKCRLRYADTDYEYGVGFSFMEITSATK